MRLFFFVLGSLLNLSSVPPAAASVSRTCYLLSLAVSWSASLLSLFLDLGFLTREYKDIVESVL